MRKHLSRTPFEWWRVPWKPSPLQRSFDCFNCFDSVHNEMETRQKSANRTMSYDVRCTWRRSFAAPQELATQDGWVHAAPFLLSTGMLSCDLRKAWDDFSAEKGFDYYSNKTIRRNSGKIGTRFYLISSQRFFWFIFSGVEHCNLQRCRGTGVRNSPSSAALGRAAGLIWKHWKERSPRSR